MDRLTTMDLLQKRSADIIDMKELGRRGKEASRIIGKTGAAEKNRCLEAIAAALWAERAAILDANAQDVAAGRENGLNEGFVDRLTPVSYTHLPCKLLLCDGQGKEFYKKGGFDDGKDLQAGYISDLY